MDDSFVEAQIKLPGNAHPGMKIKIKLPGAKVYCTTRADAGQLAHAFLIKIWTGGTARSLVCALWKLPLNARLCFPYFFLSQEMIASSKSWCPRMAGRIKPSASSFPSQSQSHLLSCEPASPSSQLPCGCKPASPTFQRSQRKCKQHLRQRLATRGPFGTGGSSNSSRIFLIACSGATVR